MVCTFYPITLSASEEDSNCKYPYPKDCPWASLLILIEITFPKVEKYSVSLVWFNSESILLMKILASGFNSLGFLLNHN